MRGLSEMVKMANWRKTTKKSRAATFALLVGGALGVGGANLAATAEDGASGSRRLEAVAKGEDSCFALLVGVDKYDELSPLGCASSDAKALRDVLLEIGFPEENVWMLTSDGSRRERPTKENIEDALDEILEESGPNATVLVALSGHGYETRDGEASFCPKDVEVEEIGDETYVTKDSAIMVDEVTTLLRRDDAKFKMLIVDACRETASTKSARKGRARSFSKPDASGIAFLQSCRSSELSYEDAEFGRGIFTHYFIEGLRGAAGRGDGGASFLDVCGYAASKTKERARKTHKASQTPYYEFAGSDFWLKEPTGNAADALYREGRALAFGLNGTKIDGVRGLELLTQAAEAGSMEAQAELAQLYWSGCEGTAPDAVKAFALAQEPARRGNPFALGLLGEYYRLGRVVDKDEAQAEAYFKRAFQELEKLAENGDARAKTYCGISLLAGKGCQKNQKAGMELLREAAELQYPRAMARLASFYIRGDGVEKDLEFATQWLQEAADAGEAEAMLLFGVLYMLEGKAETAVQWWRQGAGLNDSMSMFGLGNCYNEGNGVEKNEAIAVEWFRKSAEMGNADAMNRLGVAYGAGAGVEKNTVKGFEWYRKSAEMGNADAMFSISVCYLNGAGVEENEAEAFKWAEQSAQAGCENAWYALGLLYANGWGTDVDKTKAFEYFHKGAEAGIADAMVKLGNCYLEGEGVAQDYEKAEEWYRRAAELKNPLGMVGLVRLYFNGLGVTQDFDEAKKWLNEAEKYGDEKLKEAVKKMKAILARLESE